MKSMHLKDFFFSFPLCTTFLLSKLAFASLDTTKEAQSSSFPGISSVRHSSSFGKESTYQHPLTWKEKS